MAGVTVELESMREAEKSLAVYIENMSDSVKKLRSNAEDCRDNMENDEYSRKMVGSLEDCLTDIEKNLTCAEEIKIKIHNKIIEIENSLAAI